MSLASTQQIAHHRLQRVLCLDRAPAEIFQANLVHLLVEGRVGRDGSFIVLICHLLNHLEFTKFYSFKEELQEAQNGRRTTIRPSHVLEVLSDGSRFAEIGASLKHVEASPRHEEVLFTFITSLHHMFHAFDYFSLISRFEVELVCARVKALLLETVSEVACDFWSRVLREIHNSLDNSLGSS